MRADWVKRQRRRGVYRSAGATRIVEFAAAATALNDLALLTAGQLQTPGVGVSRVTHAAALRFSRLTAAQRCIALSGIGFGGVGISALLGDKVAFRVEMAASG